MKRTSLGSKLSIGLVVVLLVNLMYGMMGAQAAGTFQVSLKQPLNGAKGVPVDTNQIQLEFGRDVKMAGGTIEVRNSADSTVIATEVITPQSFAISRYDINLPTPLAYNTTYQITGGAGIFVDANDSSNVSEAINLSFTTLSAAGSTNPAYVPALLSPGNGQTVSGTSTSLSITFDKAIFKGTGNIYVKRASNNQSVATFAVSQPEVTVSGSTASFTVNNLTAGERYYILIDSGAFKDIDDHPFTGISSASEWYFNVQGTPVGWSSTVPANNATGVPVTGTIQLNFTRPVYPVAGSIRLELNNTSGTLVKEYSVTSADVSGGGTNKITLTLPTLAYNTSYTVKVPAGLFEDSDHNILTVARNWSFTTGSSTSTTLVPTFSPADRSTNNAVTVTPTVKFKRTIQLNNASGIKLYKQGSTTPVGATVSLSSDKMQVIIKPDSKLQEASTYYVDIANGAISDYATGANYPGISGATSWTFQTVSADKTAPVLQNATMYSNSTIRLQYNEALDSSVSLLTSSFTVTVNGETRRLSSAYLSGDSVYVTLETGVAVGQKITISYSVNSVRPIRDAAGNNAAAFSKEVTNSIDSVLPKPKEGYVSGSTVTLYFSESLKTPSSYAYQQFTVTADGYSKGIKSMSQSGSTVTLYLSSSVSNGEVVKVSYYPGSYPLEDTRGQKISEFTDFFVRNYNDTKPPELTNIEGSGNKIVLSYNEALSTTSIPLKSQFSVLVNNAAVYVTNVEISGNQVYLTLASSFTQAQAVTLSYVSGVGGIADLNGNLAGYINLQPVTYGVVTEGVRSAIVRGDTLTVTFSSTLKSVSYLPANQFYVSVDQTNRGIQSATVSGDTVTLKLSSAVTPTQSVKLSYMVGSTPLYDSLGNMIKSFSELNVQNLTGTTTNTGNTATGQPSYLSVFTTADFGKSGYVLPVNTTQILSATSKKGQTVNKYTLDNTKVMESFKYLGNNEVSSRMLVFEVPSTEKAAYVVVPMAGFMELYNSGKTGSFAVRYGNVLYEIPIEKIPYVELSRSLMATSLNTVNLVVQIEPTSRNQVPTSNSNSAVTLTALLDPVQIDVSAYNEAASQNAVNVDHTGRVLFRVSGQTSVTNQASLVSYDLTKGSISHVPSSTTVSSGKLIFEGSISGNLLVGPVLGYSYFTDVARHWASSDITELANKLIVEPRSSSSNFEPNKNITRAEFAVFIAKGLGLAGDEASARRFPDVSSGTTAAYIGAAAKAGIINGNADGTFKPNSNITREQMALMMVRAMEYAGYNTSMNGASTATLTKFKDAAKIQSKETVAKAVKEGIIQGVTTNTFQPQGNATRAQAAVMLKRVLDKLNYI